MTPAENRGLLELGMNTAAAGAFTQVTRVAMLTVLTTFTIAGVVYFFAYRGARYFTTAHAVMILGLAAIATASTEFARETLRKPYVIGSHMYSNGVRKSDVAHFNEVGFLAGSVWKPATEDSLTMGKAMFRGQCMACHTESGYRSMKSLLQARDKGNIDKLLKMLHDMPADSPYRKYMPPLVGKPDEIEALAEYLALLSTGHAPQVASSEPKKVARR